MDENLTMLEYDRILDRLAALARTAKGRERCRQLRPIGEAQLLRRRTEEAASAKHLVEAVGHAPLCAMEGLELLLEKLRLGQTLAIDEIQTFGEFLRHCRLLRRYAERAVTVDPLVGSWGLSVDPMAEISGEIDRCLRGDAVADAASPRLRSLRLEQERLSGRIKEKLASLLRAHPDWFQESYHSMRAGRYVLPVRRECRQHVQGNVLDASQSGATVFVEPESVRALQSERELLRIDEENEVQRILATLSAALGERARDIRRNADAMEDIDFAFACGRLAADMRAVPAEPTPKRMLRLKKARHPLLGPGAVPLDVELGRVRALVITGPNTGGKTVALKTVGLLALMAMSGLLVPADEAVIPLFEAVLCDIGDGQNIQQSLSTFSSHVTRVVRVLQSATGRSLVLLDELGAGTDPQEGMGLAVAVLEALGRRGCLMVATSHYPEIKRFAASAPGFSNARMTFDRATLTPKYCLEMGEAGESCALHIAERLGVPEPILERAWRAAYPSGEKRERGGLPETEQELSSTDEEPEKGDSSAFAGIEKGLPSTTEEPGKGSTFDPAGIEQGPSSTSAEPEQGAFSAFADFDQELSSAPPEMGQEPSPASTGTGKRSFSAPAGTDQGPAPAFTGSSWGSGEPPAVPRPVPAREEEGSGAAFPEGASGDRPALGQRADAQWAEAGIEEDMPVAAEEAEKAPAGPSFAIGDAVFVTSMGRHGIVCKERNARGEVGVRIQGKNFVVQEKRLKPFIAAEQLYPGENYDLDIVLKTWDERKQVRDIRKGKKGAVHEIEPGRE